MPEPLAKPVPPTGQSPEQTLALVVLLAAHALIGLVLAGRWSLLADEAYYALWSTRPALGYFDQPPLIAWVLAPLAPLHSDVALRLPALLCGVVAPLVLLRLHADRVFAAAWWAGVVPLAWLTAFMTPDALLLALWAGTLAAAARGGRGWWLAGLLGALAGLAKHSGLLVFPLAALALREREARMGLAVWLAVLAPHLAWLATHDLVTVRFQLHEGVLNAHPPGPLGPLQVLAQQAALLNPLILGSIVVVWARGIPGDRVGRLAWITSAPVALAFLLASFGGPPDAHWLAPCWVGAGILVSRARGRLARVAWTGIGIGLFASLLLVAHGEWGVFRIPLDPRDRIQEGPYVAEGTGAWALPEGVGPLEPGVERASPVLTERYQEAALVWWYTGIPARRHPLCGRSDQFDLWPEPVPEAYIFVRPARGGPLTCIDTDHAPPRHRIDGVRPDGRVVGRWDVFDVHP
ncbi:MAG: hypothetical protein H6736_01635 [Alphaproteobacteria bacterium]|nr:hypothetical protein [Alphaproteobacteria bacterium]